MQLPPPPHFLMLPDRFWSKVKKTDTCWFWIGAKATNGYGRFKFAGRCVSPHRISYESVHGPTSLNVCHKCDTPSCVRPDHLFAGTQSANMKDAMAKGRAQPPSPRAAFGTQNRQSTLSAGRVAELRKRVQEGESVYAVAKHMKLDKSYAYKVVKGLARIQG